MHVKFKDDELENFYERKKSKFYFFNFLQEQFIAKVNLLKFAPTLRAIQNVRSLNFEKYKEGKYKGKFSIRVNDQRRVIIDLLEGTEITLILEEIVDYH